MKKSVLFTILSILILSLTAIAQDEEFRSSRLDNFVNQLKRDTVDLVDRTSEDLRRSSSASRAVIEEAFLAAQLDASVGVFQDMIRDRRRGTELRDAAVILNELARRAPSYGNNGYLWRNVQNSINDINRELGGSGGGGGGGNTNPRPIIGRVYWRGMVDDKVQLIIRNNQVETRTVSGRAYPDGTYSFTSSLPFRNVEVGVTRTRGRGNVRVIQQPTKSNDFTTIVEIYDNDGGAREYQLDIYWR